MTNYVVADTGDAQRQDGSEAYPFVDTEGMKAVQKVAKPGDTVIVRGAIMGTVRWNAPGVSILPHSEGGCIDGAYRFPTGSAAWRGPDGEGVHTSLVSIRADDVTWKVPIYNSRGRSIQLLNCNNSHIQDTKILGSRTRLVDFRAATNCSIVRCEVADGSNYYKTREGRDINTHNFSGCIATDDSENILIADNIVHHHYGNVITPNTSRGVSVLRNQIYDCNGSFIYSHWSDDVTIIGNTGWYTEDWTEGIHSFIVVNNESEDKFAGHVAGNVHVENNVCLGTSHGFSVWGNEGKSVEQGELTVFDNVFMSCTEYGIMTRKNASFKKLTLRDNIYTGDLILQSSSPTVEENNAYHTPVYPTRTTYADQVRELALLLRIQREPVQEEEEMLELPRDEYIRFLNETSAMVERMRSYL